MLDGDLYYAFPSMDLSVLQDERNKSLSKQAWDGRFWEGMGRIYHLPFKV